MMLILSFSSPDCLYSLNLGNFDAGDLEAAHSLIEEKFGTIDIKKTGLIESWDCKDIDGAHVVHAIANSINDLVG